MNFGKPGTYSIVINAEGYKIKEIPGISISDEYTVNEEAGNPIFDESDESEKFAEFTGTKDGVRFITLEKLEDKSQTYVVKMKFRNKNASDYVLQNVHCQFKKAGTDKTYDAKYDAKTHYYVFETEIYGTYKMIATKDGPLLFLTLTLPDQEKILTGNTWHVFDYESVEDSVLSGIRYFG